MRKYSATLLVAAALMSGSLVTHQLFTGPRPAAAANPLFPNARIQEEACQWQRRGELLRRQQLAHEMMAYVHDCRRHHRGPSPAVMDRFYSDITESPESAS